MKIKIFTIADNHLMTKYKPEMEILLANKEKYSNLHWYDLHVQKDRLSDRPPSWDKIMLIMNEIESGSMYDYFMWIDADAAFSNTSIRIESLIFDSPEECIFIVGEYPNALNCGIFIMKNCKETLDFLKVVWSKEQHIYNTWWEQMAIIETIMEGYDIKWMKLHNRKFNSIYFDGCTSTPRTVTGIADYDNWVDNTYQEGDFIIHMPGYNPDEKYKQLANFVKSRGLL